MQLEEITREDFLQWKLDPRTREAMQLMREEREKWVFKLVNGGTLCGCGPTSEETARAVGVIYGIDLFLEAKWLEE